jgi:hypothetical protein
MAVFCKCCARKKYEEQLNTFEPLLNNYNALHTLYTQAVQSPEMVLMVNDVQMKADQCRLILQPVYDAINEAQECGIQPCECGACPH